MTNKKNRNNNKFKMMTMIKSKNNKFRTIQKNTKPTKKNSKFNKFKINLI